MNELPVVAASPAGEPSQQHRRCPARRGRSLATLALFTVLVAGVCAPVQAMPDGSGVASAAQDRGGPVADCGDDGPYKLAAYRLVDGRLDLRKGVDCIEGRRIWQRFTRLIPASQRRMVTRFELLSERVEGAEVYPNFNANQWTLAMGRRLQPDLDFVLIHEFAHLLTLRAGQVPPAGRNGRRVEQSCKTYFTGEGCARAGSVINRFVTRFWTDAMIRQADNEVDLFARYPNRFVTDYAALNPAEDIADTFATFVTSARPQRVATVADQKLNFFWNRRGMVRLRAHIRSAF